MRNLIFLLLLVPSLALAQRTILLTDKNTVLLDAEFTSETTSEVVEKFQKLTTLGDKYLVLISPGGEISSGLSMIDSLNGISNKIHTISVFSASMGFVTVQGMKRRYITPHGILMSHRAHGGMRGQFPNGELESRLNFWLKRINNLDKLTVKRTKGKLSLKQYTDMYSNEMWCEGQDCVNLGFADEVVLVKCDKSLLGDIVKDVSINFLGQRIDLSISRSKCPIVEGYKIVNSMVDGVVYTISKDPRIDNYINDYVKSINDTRNVRN
jgi:ATP-dependent protease ClpP protease subunit